MLLPDLTKAQREDWRWTPLKSLVGKTLAVANNDAAPLQHAPLFADNTYLGTLLNTDTLPLETHSFKRESQFTLVAKNYSQRTHLIVEEGATLSLVEQYANAQQDAPLLAGLKITIKKGARVIHTRSQKADEATNLLNLSTIHIGEGASYIRSSLSTGAAFARDEVHIHLDAPEASATLNAAQLLGAGQTGDLTVKVYHHAPHCQSKQNIRTVLTGNAKGIFQGLVRVDIDAQKTDGQQLSRALLLSDSAQMNSKPELEIFADDVKCSHGATLGTLDPLALYYLQARGIPLATAKRLLVEAFVAELFEGSEETQQQAFLSDLATWMKGA